MNMNYGAEDAENFLGIENAEISPNTWQLMTCLNPLNMPIPKIPVSFFFLQNDESTSPRARLNPLGGGGGGFWPEGCIHPFPPPVESPPPQFWRALLTRPPQCFRGLY